MTNAAPLYSTETTTRTGTLRVIYRCPACERTQKLAGVKRPVVALRTAVVRKTRTTEIHGLTGHRTTRHSEFSRDGITFGPYLPTATCPAGHEMFGKPVRGTLNPEIKCNAKCQGATGHDCECACGGKNHGAAFDAPWAV